MVVTGGAQDDQLHPAFVFFDLRAQVKALGVLDGKLMQTERIPDLVELVAAGLDYAQPDEPALIDLQCRLIQRDRPVALTATVEIVSAVDDHRRPPAKQRRTQLLAPFNPGSSLPPRFTAFLEELMGDRTVIRCCGATAVDVSRRSRPAVVENYGSPPGEDK